MQETGVEGNSKELFSNNLEKLIESPNSRAKLPKINHECVEDEQRWQTITQDSYPVPGPDLSRSLGRRRELVKNFIGLQVFGETINAIVAEPPPQPVSPSEYVDNFCDSKFIPFINRTEYDYRKHQKYPLYGGATVQSYYKSQLDRGTLKSRSDIYDFNQPFRRSCSFTTPPDLAFREPTGGY